MWEQNGLVVTVFGRGGLPPVPLTPLHTVILAERFLHDAKHGILGEVAFVGLIQYQVTTGGISSNVTNMCSVLIMDMAGIASN